MFDGYFYEELHFYEQWWVLIDLTLLVLASVAGALASYRRSHFWPIRVVGFTLGGICLCAMLLGIILAWNLPEETIEVFSAELLQTVKTPPEPRRVPNYMNSLAAILSFLIPFLGWRVARFAWYLRQESSRYQVTA